MTVRFPLLVLAAFFCLVAGASAHVERPGYWPDPAVDTAVPGGAGGGVPKVRSLSSALDRKRPGDTRVVCQADSLRLLEASMKKARSGYEIRPSDKRKLTGKQMRHLRAVNKRLFKLCKYREIQPAVTASHNNDRVVVMPGLYTEPTARATKTHDPACDSYRTNGDRPGDKGIALAYAYQFHCPNDQNLVAVIGREPGPKPAPIPPLDDRHGIPDLGKCLRCNLQLEGSGVNADDVAIEAGDASKGDGGPNGVGTAKDVAVRADRADGFVLRNLKVRHAKEHGIYVIESDGYLLTHFKAYYNGLYGVLSFVEDHGIQEHCDSKGHGDSGVYPGAAAETGQQRSDGTEFRYNQEIRFCDLHHNMAGYSGTSSNAVHVHDNRFYDNVLGLTTDVITGAGHPGFPGDSMLIENNRFYSNNFNVYDEDSSVKPAFPFPVGTGMWIAGGNRETVRNNYFYDNWRRGTMLFSVPDQLVCGEAADGNQQHGCNPSGLSTSFYNSQHDNTMGVSPDGKVEPNGTDFWWDPYPGTVGNCWWGNKAAPGATITQSPAAPALPGCENGSRPDESVGTGNPAQTGELLSCVAAFQTRNFDKSSPCPWFKTPPKPGSAAARTAPAATSSAMTMPFPKQVSAPADGYIDRRSDFSGVSCADWNSAGDDGRAWILSKLRTFAGGSVNDGEHLVGYGRTMSDADAANLFSSWCPRTYAQGFVLFKLYTYAVGVTPRA